MAKFKLHGDEVWEGGGNRTLATVDDARRMIDGAGSLDEMTVVALWWALTHRP